MAVARLIPEKAECFVAVFKAGALSRMGHDVLLQFGSVRMTIGEALSIKAEFDIASLRVVAAMRNGEPDPSVLSPKDHAEILGNVVKTLQPRRFPTAVFQSRSVRLHEARYEIEGTLTLHGVTQAVQLDAPHRDGWATARLQLHQPDYGIAPFKALLGALRIKPDVGVEIRVPVET